MKETVQRVSPYKQKEEYLKEFLHRLISLFTPATVLPPSIYEDVVINGTSLWVTKASDFSVQPLHHHHPQPPIKEGN